MTISFESERLRLRPICESDFPAIHDLLLLPETDRYNALGLPQEFAQSKRLATSWIELMQEEPALAHTLSIELLADNSFIGMFGFKLSPTKYRRSEIWYKLHKDYWGVGYATESVKRSIEYCFQELGLHRVEAGVATENIASIRVLEKAGMQREGLKRKDLPLATGFSDTYMYAILEDDLK